MGLYDLDFHAWATAQADAIRRRSMNELDWDNLMEEIESLGRSVRSELRSRLAVIATHLLKWTAQPSFRSRSWINTIRIQRRDLRRLLDENPSLVSIQQERFEQAYDLARLRAAAETGLPPKNFPEQAPFDLQQALDEDWLPDPLPPGV